MCGAAGRKPTIRVLTNIHGGDVMKKKKSKTPTWKELIAEMRADNISKEERDVMARIVEIASSVSATLKAEVEAYFRAAGNDKTHLEREAYLRSHPLSAGAQALMQGIEELGLNYSEQQKKFRENQQRASVEKQEQWRKWQAAEKSSNPQFARLKSKQEQAKLLKKKHSISDEVGTIAKQLEPLPRSKRKK
jgi:hypothetical protein